MCPLPPSHLLSHSPPTPGCHRTPSLTSLHHTANPHLLSVFNIVMYMLPCYCLNLSHSLLPPLLYAQLLSHVQFFGTLWTVACWALLSTGFPWQKYWSGLTFPSPGPPLYINTYVGNLERWYWWTYMQSSNGDTDIVNRLVADKLSIFFVKVEKNEKTDTTKCKEKKQNVERKTSVCTEDD